MAHGTPEHSGGGHRFTVKIFEQPPVGRDRLVESRGYPPAGIITSYDDRSNVVDRNPGSQEPVLGTRNDVDLTRRPRGHFRRLEPRDYIQLGPYNPS